MEIFTLLETLEEMLENSKTVPFLGKCIVEKEEILDMIKEIRLKGMERNENDRWPRKPRQAI